MSLAYRSVPPCPPEFAEEFVRGGWRRVERIYGPRSDLLMKWIEQSGGDELYARRRAVRCGSQVTIEARGAILTDEILTAVKPKVREV